jgi:hypothetical protein
MSKESNEFDEVKYLAHKPIMQAHKEFGRCLSSNGAQRAWRISSAGFRAAMPITKGADERKKPDWPRP